MTLHLTPYFSSGSLVTYQGSEGHCLPGHAGLRIGPSGPKCLSTDTQDQDTIGTWRGLWYLQASLPQKLASSQTQEWAWQASGQASWVRECPRGAVTGAPCRVVRWVRSSQINVCGVTAWGFCGSECRGKILCCYAGRHCHHKESTNRKGLPIAQDSFQTCERSGSCFLIHNVLP